MKTITQFSKLHNLDPKTGKMYVEFLKIVPLNLIGSPSLIFKRRRLKKMESDFERDLAKLLNNYNYDTKTNTPDYMLAEKIKSDLDSLAKMMEKNIEWHSTWRGDYIAS